MVRSLNQLAILVVAMLLAAGFSSISCGGFKQGADGVVCTSTTAGRTGCECKRVGNMLCEDPRAMCNESGICEIPVVDGGVADASVDAGLPCGGICGSGLQCVNNACVPGGDASVTDGGNVDSCNNRCGGGTICQNGQCVLTDAGVVTHPDATVFQDASAGVRSVQIGVWATADEVNAMRDFARGLRGRELTKGFVAGYCGGQGYNSPTVPISANSSFMAYFSKSLANGEECRWWLTGQADNGDTLIFLPGLDTRPATPVQVVLVRGEVHFLDTNEVRAGQVVPNAAGNGRDFMVRAQ